MQEVLWMMLAVAPWSRTEKSPGANGRAVRAGLIVGSDVTSAGGDLAAWTTPVTGA
jgi:hypothetical protein